ncbi:MAG: transposase [Prolixibacteraceae bacterium]|nr:transposase [Prolixibacteraceae bacterium]
MSQSLSKLYIHLVFHVKNPLVLIRREDKDILYAYIGSIIKDNSSIPVIINGTSDHIHILCVMSKNISLAALTEEIKRHSSRWIKTLGDHYRQFSWQAGYAGFSISQSLHNKTVLYIKNQEEHHKKMTFQEELILFLKEYGIDYDERYLWTD